MDQPFGTHNQQPYYGSHDSKVWDILIATTNFGLWMLLLAAHLEQGCACGMSGKWLVSLVAVFLGPPIGGIIIYFVIGFVVRLAGNRDPEKVAWPIFFGYVWAHVFIISVVIVYSMTCGQIYSAENGLQPKMATSIHCWRNPDERFNEKKYNWITLEESSWSYKLINMSIGNYARYALIPLVYTGKAPSCTYNFWAACYLGFSLKDCGLDFPPNTVTMRTMNDNEEFFNLFGGDDEESVRERDAYKALRDQISPDPRYQAPIVVDYANDGPEGLENHREAAEASKEIQKICYYVLYGLSVMCHSVWVMQMEWLDWWEWW